MKPEAAVGEQELLALYARYKHLALGTGAGLMLDTVPTELVEETWALVADCRCAAAAAPHGPLTPLFEACTGAAVALHDLVLSGRTCTSTTTCSERTAMGASSRSVWPSGAWSGACSLWMRCCSLSAVR